MAGTAPDRRRPIGVFDSGLGGLTVLRELHRRLPCEDLIYFGDTARVPYGTKGEKTVRNFARQDAGLLVGLGVKLVVVACNTASAFALDHLQEVLPVPVLGVIEPGVSTALKATRGGAVGVIGTPGTIRSGRYQAGLQAGTAEFPGVPGGRILVQECPLLVPLVEEGWESHPVTRMTLDQYLGPMRDAGVDTLILGCTHYPLLKAEISEYMGPAAVLVDSAEALAAAAEGTLADLGLRRRDGDPAAGAGKNPPEGALSFYLSDIPWKFAEIGARFLGKPINNVETVGLDAMEEAGRLVLKG
ncbi:MAG: glutamate racemase [bacterium]